ncbi:TonB-dependent receptor [Acinetobacter nematophilus]|uniref:TonB-dependent siderophore receptor n=1 Tax=Acinetobacter nematophilus TaxID=2994642 RepID=A0A9X3DX03_9GAMM|nr:TonB-dependent siderophore receptor [Acinetobacter nematophilus]MCX5469520.1 TonB-dependent siderophore receptor [Acinetobacter nematophilus]
MSFIKSRKKIVSTAIASSLSVIATSAIAQDEIAKLPTIKAQATAEQSLKVDESANQKFVAPLLDTPKSISVISKKLIEDTQVTTLADALRTVPGITLGAGEGGNPNGDRPFIRGYNSESSMYVDGVRNSTSQNREMFAVEQVEVTKGSASSLGGAGSVGGSVNMISKVAKKGDYLEGSVAGGTDNYQRITLDGNKDFGNGIAARVAVMGHHNEKAGQDDGAEYKRAGIAPSITFGLDTPTRATLSYYYLKSDDTPDSGVPYNYDASKKATFGKPVDVKQGIYYGLHDRDFQKQENQIGTIKLEHDLNENLTITNTAVYNKSTNDYLWTQPDDSKGNVLNDKVWRRINSRITDTNIFTDQLALTGKFNTGEIKHKFNVGAEYSDQKSDKGNYTITYPGYTGTTTGGFNSDCKINDAWCTSLTNPNSKEEWLGSANANRKTTTTTTKVTSVYLLDNIEFNPQWLLDLGVRWDKFDTEQVTNATGLKLENNKDFFTYQAGLTFKPMKNGSLYASYATSANPVGVDGGDGSEAIGQAYMDLKPEEARTYELGTKWDFLDERLNLTVAVFRTEKQNTRIQLDAGTYTNGGESKVDGVEFTATGKLTDKWDITAGYSYLDSEMTNPGPSCTRAGVCTLPNPAKGKQLPNVPKNSATLWTTYQVLPQLTLGAGALAMDKVYGDAANTKFVPGYVRYDAMARYNVNKNVDLQLNLNNLSDQRYFTKAYASHYATEAEGRNAVLSINFKY